MDTHPHMQKWKKRKKPMDNSSSINEDSIERSSKKGCKSLKKVWEEEAKRLKMQGSQATIEMSIAKNTRARPSKGGPIPFVK